MSEAADLAGVPSLLATRELGRAFRHLARCSSTSDEASAWARAGAPHGAVVVADTQEGGRGRLGRSWHSPAGANVYLSVVLRPNFAPHRAPPLTLLAGVALCEAVAAEGAAPSLKWPNDLLLAEGGAPRKAGGILLEMATAGGRIEHVVCGIGVNVNLAAFPPELSERATSLARVLGRPVDRARLTARLLGALEEGYGRFLVEGPAPMVAAWKRLAPMIGSGQPLRVQAPSGIVEGVAEDVTGDGVLVVRGAGGSRHHIIAGEIEDR